MPIFGQPSPLEADIEKATSETLVSENWPLIFEICDKVKTSEEKGCKDCVQFVLKRLQNKNQRVVYYTLILLEALGKNCGEQFILQISTRGFCQEIQSLLQNKKSSLPTQQPRVRNKLLNLIESWNKQYGDSPDYSRLNELYTKLKNDPTVIYPDAATMAADASVSPASIMTTSAVGAVGGGSSSSSSGLGSSYSSHIDASSNNARSSSKKEDDDLAKAIALSLKESSQSGLPDLRPSVSSALLPSAPYNIGLTDTPLLSVTNQNGPVAETKKVRAMYDFEAAESNELTFKAGEIIILQDDSDENWWKGENHRGSGLFPAHFVTKDLDAPVPDVEEEEETTSKKNSSVAFKDEVKVIEYSKTDANSSESSNGGRQNITSNPVEIDADKIAQVLRYLETADPTGMSEDPADMVALEAHCYGMGPLIDEQLNQLDQEHVKLSELNKKVIDALNMYHKLMEQSPAAPPPPTMTSFNAMPHPQGSIPPGAAMSIQQLPTYPAQGQPPMQQNMHLSSSAAPTPMHQPGAPNYLNYPGQADSNPMTTNQEGASAESLKQINSLNHQQQGDYTTVQAGYTSANAQGSHTSQYGSAMGPQYMAPPNMQTAPPVVPSMQQQTPLQQFIPHDPVQPGIAPI